MDHPAASKHKKYHFETHKKCVLHIKYDGTFRKHKLEMSYIISMMEFQSNKVIFVYIYFWIIFSENLISSMKPYEFL